MIRSRLVSGMLVFDLMVFFWKMVVDVHDRFCKNVGCVVDNVDGIRIILKNS